MNALQKLVASPTVTAEQPAPKLVRIADICSASVCGDLVGECTPEEAAERVRSGCGIAGCGNRHYVEYR